MPYLRLYSRNVPIEQKGIVTQKLIEVTLRTFHLCPEDRNRVTVQFIPPPQVSGADVSQSVIPRGADFMLEVIAHHLTEANKKAFAEEAAAMLVQLLPTKPRSRSARLLGIKPDSPSQVALQFDELSPAISDPTVMDPERRAA
jgi:hypothetical protein